MQITKDKVVSIDYTLTNDDGDVIDSSDGRGPLLYLQGHQNIIPGLEKEMEGKAAGDELSVKITPAEGYGDRKLELIQQVPVSAFQGVEKVEVGMQFQVQGENGAVLMVTVTAVEGENVTIDGNHPLAGQNLNFAVKVVEVRDASQEEITHGHVNGPGGHEH